jgi:hypothetical protein
MITTILLLALSSLAGAGDEAPQAKPATPVAPAQDPDRPALSAAELKALRESNIFSPRFTKPRTPREMRSDRKSAPPAYRQKAPVVTGIFLDPTTRAPQAIVEDKNDSAHRYFKEPKFMKIGDEWAGIKLESITPEKVVFSKDGASKDVRIGESLPDTEERPTSLADPGDDPLVDDGEAPAPSAASPVPATKIRKGPGSDATGAESKSMTPENQTRTLEEMKKRLKKKNRPGDNEE